MEALFALHKICVTQHVRDEAGGRFFKVIYLCIFFIVSIFWLEAIAIRLQAIAFRLEAAIRLEAVS